MKNIHYQKGAHSCSHSHLLRDILGEKSSGEYICAECGYMAPWEEFNRMRTQIELAKVKGLLKNS